jgi:hypothetical protein
MAADRVMLEDILNIFDDGTEERTRVCVIEKRGESRREIEGGSEESEKGVYLLI